MTWRVIYHDEVVADLEAIGQSEARIILKVIEKRINLEAAVVHESHEKTRTDSICY